MNRRKQKMERRKGESNFRGRREVSCWLLTPAMCFLFLLGLSRPALGTVAEVVSAPVEDFILSWVEELPLYQREGRSDPFSPFISERLMHVDAPKEELTGLRRFEPGQLTLVSVVFTEQGSLAMVEDSVGRGYILREGTKIGRLGVVAQIIPNEVIIKQQTLTSSGDQRLQTVELILRKEGER
jgi:hypothetical protein